MELLEWQRKCLHADPAELDRQASAALDEMLGQPRERVLEILPDTLREGVDRVNVSRLGDGLFVGRWRGRLPMVLLDGVDLPIVVNPYRLVETAPLPSSVDWFEWNYGYLSGTDHGWNGGTSGRKSVGNIPTDFSRGFAKGSRQAEDRKLFAAPVNAYNEEVRSLAARYPDEHWVGVPQ